MGMSVAEFVAFVRQTNGLFFSVEFTKRSTGELRLMNCRTGVKKGLVGGGAAYDPKSHNLLCVYDMTKKDYRSISLEGLLRVKKDGEWHEIVHEPQVSKGAQS